MTNLNGVQAEWTRVRPDRPCPKCERTDWCSLAADDSAVICMRVESDRPTKNGGWLHRLAEDAARPPRAAGRTTDKPRDWGAEAAKYAAKMGPERLQKLAARLGLPVEGLAALP